MTEIPRFAPEFPLPPYAFLPGKHPHPNKEGGHGFSIDEFKVVDFDSFDLSKNKENLFSIDLYNHGFFWEAHVGWEAVWNALGRRNAKAKLVQGLVLLSAGHLKWKLGQKDAAKGHFKRACDLVKGCEQIELLSGFNGRDAMVLIEKTMASPDVHYLIK